MIGKLRNSRIRMKLGFERRRWEDEN